MKKLITTLLMVLLCSKAYAVVTTTAYLSPNDVTVATLESNRATLTDSANDFDGSAIQLLSISAGALDANANPENRWDDTFNDYVYTGLLPPTTSGTLTSTTTAGRAYIFGTRVVKDATANTYTASKHTYVDLSNAGTYTYSEVAIGGTEPATAANSIRLALVSTDATQVFAVTDKRVTAVTLTGGSNEDFQRVGMTISVTTPDAIVMSPGVAYHGATRIVKTGTTSLALGTASDYTTGVSQRATSTMGFVVVDSDGNIKLTTTAPTYHDTSENTAGKLRYSDSNSENWRVLAWFYMNATGSGEIDDGIYSNFKDGDEYNFVTISGDTDITIASTAYVEMTDMVANFYTAGGPVHATFTAPVNNDGGTKWTDVAISINNVIYAKGRSSAGDSTNAEQIAVSWMGWLPQGSHKAQAIWRNESNNSQQEGETEGGRFLILQEF